MFGVNNYWILAISIVLANKIIANGILVKDEVTTINATETQSTYQLPEQQQEDNEHNQPEQQQPQEQQQQQQQPQQQHPQQQPEVNLFDQLNAFIQSRAKNVSEISENVYFKYYNRDNQLVYQSRFDHGETFDETGCDPDEKFAILLHGWRETCEEAWMRLLIKKLNKFRGGCIICMDYGYYARDSYVRLMRIYEPMVQILTLQLFLLDYLGFDMEKGYMFGFSYGGQMATEAGRRIGHRRFKEIDTCDMAGPGFDHLSIQPDHRVAAQNVQCIHTSRDKGTRFYNCHQDWRLGNCGFAQIAASDPPFGSHGLCPYMYVSAFENNFYAIDKPGSCQSKLYAPVWPYKYKMGYMEARKWQVNGELFALTGKYFPFTGPINETYTMMIKEQQDLQAESRHLEARERATSVFERIKLRFLKRYFS